MIKMQNQGKRQDVALLQGSGLNRHDTINTPQMEKLNVRFN
jgi:hypothetical protein